MGAAILSVINNALVVLEVNIYAQDIVQGGLVVAALLVDQFRRGTLTWGDVFKPRL
jgi:ribose/xylose/arabinose/galactoside ABC-type transport system permease subunit